MGPRPPNAAKPAHGPHNALQAPNLRGPHNGPRMPVLQHAVVGVVGKSDTAPYVESLGDRVRFPLQGRGSESVQAGQCIIADLSDPPTQVARLREVLPSHDSLRTRILAIAAENGARFGFSDAAMAEIAQLQKDQANRPRGLDLTHLPFVTIDNPTTRVMDQAIHIAREGEGYVLRYAIADATAMVPPHSAISAEACERSASLYLPCDPPATTGEAVSMLEPSLGDMMGSLRPDEEHAAFIAEVHLDADGAVVAHSFARGTVESRAKLCFGEVQDYFDTGRGPLVDAAFADTLNLIRELGRKLERRAEARGVLDLNNEGPSLGVAHGTENTLEVQAPGSNRQIDRWNAQVSILINQLVGDTFAQANIRGLWRVQEAPDAQRLRHLRTALQQLGRTWKPGQSLQSYLKSFQAGDNKLALARLLILQHSRPASFSTEPVGHDALKLEHYSQFTAPMRRYPDVAVHHMLSALVEHRAVPYQDDPAFLDAVVRNADAFRTREKTVLRQVDALLTAAALKPLIDAPLQGVVVGIRPNSGMAEIALQDPPVHVQTPLKSAPKLHLGDAVRVTVTDVDTDASTVDVTVAHTARHKPRHKRRAA